MVSVLAVLVYVVAFIVGVGLIPFLIYSRMLPNFIGDRIGNGLLTIVAMARGGNKIKGLRSGNFEIEDYEPLEPKKNRDQLHNSPFALTYEKDAGSYGSSVVADESPGDSGGAVADGGDLAVVDGGEGYADLTETGESEGVWIILSRYIEGWKNIGTTGPIDQAEQEGKVEHGGDTKGMSEKLRVISMFGGLVLGLATGYMMFGGAL